MLRDLSQRCAIAGRRQRPWLSTGDEVWLRRPTGGEVSWLVEMEQSLLAEALLLPLYHTAHSVWADAQIRGLRFRPDGTLNYESTWISEAESSMEARR